MYVKHIAQHAVGSKCLINGNINPHKNPLKRYYYYYSHFIEAEPEDAGAGQGQS